jgi:hypothetical protein
MTLLCSGAQEARKSGRSQSEMECRILIAEFWLAATLIEATKMSPTPKDLEATLRSDRVTVGDALWRSAIDALVKTILILVMGHVALAILGGIFNAMTPSSPPFLARTSGSTNSNSSLLRSWWSAALEHQFAIVYVIIFALCVRAQLVVSPDAKGETAVAETRFQKISVRFSENWFGLIVGNAFGALISAIVIYFVGRFAGTRFLLNLLLAAVLPAVKALAIFILGTRIVNFAGGMLDWYGDNQLRFTFWILYVAAVSDDLGLPNVKTLARVLWSRWRKRNPAPDDSTTGTGCSI